MSTTCFPHEHDVGHDWSKECQEKCLLSGNICQPHDLEKGTYKCPEDGAQCNDCGGSMTGGYPNLCETWPNEGDRPNEGDPTEDNYYKNNFSNIVRRCYYKYLYETRKHQIDKNKESICPGTNIKDYELNFLFCQAGHKYINSKNETFCDKAKRLKEWVQHGDPKKDSKQWARWMCCSGPQKDGYNGYGIPFAGLDVDIGDIDENELTGCLPDFIMDGNSWQCNF